MPVVRSAAERSALVAEAIAIDKQIVAQLSLEDVSVNFTNIYDRVQSGLTSESFASEAASLSAAERVQRIVSTLIEEESMLLQTTELVTLASETTNISTKTNTIATELVTLAAETTKIAVETTKIANEITTIDDNINKIRNLGDVDIDGRGFRVLQPGGEIAQAALYLLYVKQAQAIADPDASTEEQTASIQKLQSILTELQSRFGSGN